MALYLINQRKKALKDKRLKSTDTWFGRGDFTKDS
jgi:hypothetical protein